jgi:predicted Rossmann-fold nucleotide-binding protein
VAFGRWKADSNGNSPAPVRVSVIGAGKATHGELELAEANPWVAVPLATGMGEARNALVVRAGQAVIAVGGEWGTLSEVALARKMGRPVAFLGESAWELDLPRLESPTSAVEWVEDRVREGEEY